MGLKEKKKKLIPVRFHHTQNNLQGAEIRMTKTMSRNLITR